MLPVLVHHMASPHEKFPPNSLEAIRHCLDMAAPFVEVDITALKDDDYLLVHDPVLESETTGSGAVRDCPAGEAANLFYKNPQGEATLFRVPRLSQVVQLFQDYGGSTRLQLDFKNVIPFTEDEPLRRLVRLIQPLGERVIVSTGADWQLRRMRKLADWLDLGFDVHYVIDWREPSRLVDPRIPPYRKGAYGYWDDHPLATQVYYPVAEYLAERCEMMTTLVPRLSTFYINHRLIARSLDEGFNWAEKLHEHGIKLDAWTLDIGNEAAVQNAKRLRDAGLDYLTTNTPAQMAELLKTP